MYKKENMRFISFMFGIFSLIALLFNFSVPLAALGIIFALLSRDAEPIQGKARAGLVLSIIGFVIGAIMLITSFIALSTHLFNDVYEQIMEEYEGTEYGEELEQLFDELGVDLNEEVNG